MCACCLSSIGMDSITSDCGAWTFASSSETHLIEDCAWITQRGGEITAAGGQKLFRKLQRRSLSQSQEAILVAVQLDRRAIQLSRVAQFLGNAGGGAGEPERPDSTLEDRGRCLHLPPRPKAGRPAKSSKLFLSLNTRPFEAFSTSESEPLFIGLLCTDNWSHEKSPI